MSMDLFAGLRVRSLSTARPFYVRLFGEPSFAPNEVELVWQLAERRSEYIEEDPGRAGHGLVTLLVDDLDDWAARVAGRGLEPARRETYGNGVRKFTYVDPDGNEIGFAGGAG